jgi:hypothetical protein
MLLFSEYNACNVASTSIGNYTQETRFRTLESEVLLGWPQYGSMVVAPDGFLDRRFGALTGRGPRYLFVQVDVSGASAFLNTNPGLVEFPALSEWRVMRPKHSMAHRNLGTFRRFLDSTHKGLHFFLWDS